MLLEKIKPEPGERVLIQVRKHWFILFVQLLSVVIAGIFPLGVFVVLNSLEIQSSLLIEAHAYDKYFLYGYLLWLTVIWMAGFNVWTNYYLDVWTITNKRLIAIDQKGLWNRSTGSFRLERLQDLNVDVNGIIATLLNYGTLEAQTAAGSEEEFSADGLPNPRELKSIILKAADDTMSFGNGPQHSDGV